MSNGGCQKAVYNVKVVASCPKSKEEWNIAARKKNCSKIAAVAVEKNCTIDEIQPKYHCVISALRTKLLEVCADEKRILGHCAEFNEVGRVIQIHNTAPCEKVFPNCDDAYSSVDAYKYQGCYKLVNQTKVTKNFDIDYPTSGYEKIVITIVTVIVVLLCGLAAAIALCLKSRRESGIQKEEKDVEKQTPLLYNALENKSNTGRKEKRIQKHEKDVEVQTTPTDNALENKIIKGDDLKPLRQYLYCKASRFPHFYFVYNEICEYKQQLDTENAMPNNLMIKIELVGEFTDDDLQLLPKGILNKTKKKDENIWEAIPLLCFQNDVALNSALETRPRESACHLILINSALDATDKEDNSIIIVDQNKDKILEAITSCLEQPLCHILQELSDFYSKCTERANEVMALKKTLLDNSENTKTPTVPDDIKKCLSGRSDVVEFTMMRNSSLEVRVKKETDAMGLENDLKKIDSEFFKTCRLNILKRQTTKRYTCVDAVSFNDD